MAKRSVREFESPEQKQNENTSNKFRKKEKDLDSLEIEISKLSNPLLGSMSDILFHIFMFIPVNDIGKNSSVCKLWNEVGKEVIPINNKLWYDKIDYGNDLCHKNLHVNATLFLTKVINKMLMDRFGENDDLIVKRDDEIDSRYSTLSVLKISINDFIHLASARGSVRVQLLVVVIDKRNYNNTFVACRTICPCDGYQYANILDQTVKGLINKKRDIINNCYVGKGIQKLRPALESLLN